MMRLKVRISTMAQSLYILHQSIIKFYDRKTYNFIKLIRARAYEWNLKLSTMEQSLYTLQQPITKFVIVKTYNFIKLIRARAYERNLKFSIMEQSTYTICGNWLWNAWNLQCIFIYRDYEIYGIKHKFHYCHVTKLWIWGHLTYNFINN